MAQIYLDILVIICLGLIAWGLVCLERVYQYPFFMGSIFISFLLPQAFALIKNPGQVSQQALERVLLFSCLCAAVYFHKVVFNCREESCVVWSSNNQVSLRKLTVYPGKSSC